MDMFFQNGYSLRVVTEAYFSRGEIAVTDYTSLAEENNQVNAVFQTTYKVELQSVIAKLEEQATVERSKADTLVSEIENLKAVTAQKSVLESHVEELEKEFDQNRSSVKRREAERSTLAKPFRAGVCFNKSQEEIEAKEKAAAEFESMVKDLEQQKARSSSKPKLRDIDLSFSSPTKRKSKKKTDASSSGNVVTTQTASASHLMTMKIISGVALVSVIIGIILGKK
ncbi:unnamed protein product [Cochlearia groenlandica]